MKQSTRVSLKLTEPQPKRDHIQGPHDAVINMLEYGDYECPYCGGAHGIVKALQHELGDRLCFAFRNFRSPMPTRTRSRRLKPQRPQAHKESFGSCTT